jgi:hypothetical protein
MEVVLNTRSRLLHFMEGDAELEDGRFQLVCGAFIDQDNLTFCGEPRDEAKPCPACARHLKTITRRWNAMTRVARRPVATKGT